MYPSDISLRAVVNDKIATIVTQQHSLFNDSLFLGLIDNYLPAKL